MNDRRFAPVGKPPLYPGVIFAVMQPVVTLKGGVRYCIRVFRFPGLHASNARHAHPGGSAVSGTTPEQPFSRSRHQSPRRCYLDDQLTLFLDRLPGKFHRLFAAIGNEVVIIRRFKEHDSWSTTSTPGVLRDITAFWSIPTVFSMEPVFTTASPLLTTRLSSCVPPSKY